MAFGNMGDDCGTGVAFTRDPATGAKGLLESSLLTHRVKMLLPGKNSNAYSGNE